MDCTRFYDLKIGDIFSVGNDVAYRKISDSEAEYGYHGYNRVFYGDEHVTIIKTPFEVVMKNTHWIPEELKNKKVTIVLSDYSTKDRNVYEIINENYPNLIDPSCFKLLY